MCSIVNECGSGFMTLENIYFIMNALRYVSVMYAIKNIRN